MENIQETVFKIVEKQFEVPLFKINPESQFVADFGADSLDVVEFILALEDGFKINITDDQAQQITKVKHAIEQVELIINQK